ncbi:hypothetical protein EII22_08880 [Coriobacteriales bacterium OH1046]|nr:hypothetical protein EII22_08880 [Coriobacteriales bacterium OH1046]
MRCKKPVVVEAFRATEDNIAEAGAHRGRPAGRGGDGIMIDPHTHLGVEVWLLHDSGMPLSEIARAVEGRGRDQGRDHGGMDGGYREVEGRGRDEAGATVMSGIGIGCKIGGAG